MWITTRIAGDAAGVVGVYKSPFKVAPKGAPLVQLPARAPAAKSSPAFSVSKAAAWYRYRIMARDLRARGSDTGLNSEHSIASASRGCAFESLNSYQLVPG